MRKLIVILLFFFSVGGFCQSQYTNWFTVLSDSTPFVRALPSNTLVHLLDSNKLYQLTAPRNAYSYMAQAFAAGEYREVPGGFTSLSVDTLYITDSIYDLRTNGDYFYFNDTVFGIKDVNDSLLLYIQWGDTITRIATRYDADTLTNSLYDSLGVHFDTAVDIRTDLNAIIIAVGDTAIYIHWSDTTLIGTKYDSDTLSSSIYDSLNIHWDTLVSHNARINILVNALGDTAIYVHWVDTTSYIGTKYNEDTLSVSVYDSLGIHLDSLQSHNTRLLALSDTATKHLDTLQSHNTRINTVVNSIDTLTASIYDSLHWTQAGGKLFPSTLTDDVISYDSLRIEGGSLFKDNVGIDSTAELRDIIFNEISEQSTPGANKVRVYAIADDGFTVLQTINGSGLTNRINQDNYRIARNVSGAPITKGKAVYYTGSTGNKPNFNLAQADSAATMPAIGITTATVNDNNYGEIMIVGRLTGVKTDYATWTEGDVLYIDPSTAGEMTNVRPLHPNLAQWMGTIEVVHSTNGVILVNCQSLTGIEDGTNRNSYTIGDQAAGIKSLIMDGTANSTLQWDSDLSEWEFTTGDVLSGVTSTYMLGSSGNKWRSLHVDSVNTTQLFIGAVNVTDTLTSHNTRINTVFNKLGDTAQYVKWPDTISRIATAYDISSKQNVSDTSVKDATRYWVGLQAYLTAESDPIWISDSTDYLHKSDTNTKVASRKWVTDQSYLTVESDPVWISDSTDYLHKSDTNTKVASRKWVTDQGYSTTTGTVTSISQGTGMLNSVNPITTTGTIGVDTSKVVLFNDTLTGQKIATKYELGDQVFTYKFHLAVANVASLGSLICVQFPSIPDSGYIQVLSAQIALYAVAQLDVGTQTLRLLYQGGDSVVVWTEAQLEKTAGAYIISGAIQANYDILETQWLGLQLSASTNPGGVPNATMDLYVTFRYVDMSETGRAVGCP